MSKSKRMDDITLFINSICLMYLENISGCKLDTSQKEIQEFVKRIKLRDVIGSPDDMTTVLQQLREIVLDMTKHDNSVRYVRAELEARLSVILRLHRDKMDVIRNNFDLELDPESAVAMLPSYRRSIIGYIEEEDFIARTDKYFQDFKFRRDQIDNVFEHFGKLIEETQRYVGRGNGVDNSKTVARVDFSDPSSLTAQLQTVKEDAEGRMSFRLGYKCMNRMLGGSLQGGRQVIVGALQHNYKTGITMDMFRQIAVHNVPVVRKSGKKPAILRITLEDELVDNVKQLYKDLVRNIERRAVTDEDLLSMDVAEVTSYVIEKMTKTGWSIFMERGNPSEMSYKDIQRRVLELEEAGYDVQVLIVDYLGLVPTTGCTQGPTGTDMRDLFRRMRNFCSPRGILFITPHQLSPDALTIRRSGQSNFIRTILSGGYYSGSKQLVQEVDIEICVSVERVGKDVFLEIGKGKHRGGKIVSEQDKVCCMRFQGDLGLLDDVDGPEDFAYSHPGGVLLSGGDSGGGGGDDDPFGADSMPASNFQQAVTPPPSRTPEVAKAQTVELINREMGVPLATPEHIAIPVVGMADLAPPAADNFGQAADSDFMY